MKQIDLDWKLFDPRTTIRPPMASLLMLAMVVVCGAITTAWFTGMGAMPIILEQFHYLPLNSGKLIISPAIAFPAVSLIFAVAITKISPKPRVWSRFLIVALLLILTIRYVWWRSVSTLNLSDLQNSVCSLGLFGLEMLTIFNSTLQLFLLVRTKDRKHEANKAAVAVQNGKFMPSVDVMIPTYNEPEFILRRTVIGCQALDYAHKNIYLLDDTQRPEIKALAMELGCEYMSRPEHKHAKAGNLNHAIALTNGELIVCFDADFIPTRNFLTRTIGFFQDPTVALVQTPQSFYSADPIARNLGLENILVPEQESFYRQIQPVRDGTDSVVCAGTSFVMKRSALLNTGGEFVTSSLSEDYFTAVKLSGQGYRLIYLDEKLSAGAAPDDMGAQATQRLRWAQGTLQAFFIDENPLMIPGLTLLQRISHFTGLLHWFTSLSRVGFLLIPLAVAFFGVLPVQANNDEVLFYFLPQFLVNLAVFAWLSDYSHSAFISDIYDVVLCFPLATTVIQTMIQPFGQGFKVTPKGTNRDRPTFNWALAAPLIVLFTLTAVSLWINLGRWLMHMENPIKGLNLGWFWSTYNLILLALALMVMLDLPKPDLYEWFDLRRVVKIELEGGTFWGTTSVISEIGAEIVLTQGGLPKIPKHEVIPINLEIMEEELKLGAHIHQIYYKDGFPVAKVMFEQVTLSQHRVLVQMLFCRPGQWKRQITPGELTSLWLLFRSLIKPRALFGKKHEHSAIAICQI
jgi:cellulose synthase (UDP-forming)